MSSDSLDLRSPLSGSLMALERVPDPVFAKKLVGDGVSIDPTSNVLKAPCPGVICQLHPAGHALTLRSKEGLEIMMHIGLDTVKMKGKGFETKVQEGDEVDSGDGLIEFDSDYLALHAKSLLTQVVVTNMEALDGMEKSQGFAWCCETIILKLRTKQDKREESSSFSDSSSIAKSSIANSQAVSIPNPAGLHARPAAVLVNQAKQFESKIFLLKDGREVNSKSVVSIMGLNIKYGEKVSLRAQGEDAREAVNCLLPQIRAGLGEEGVCPLSEEDAGEDSNIERSEIQIETDSDTKTHTDADTDTDADTGTDSESKGCNEDKEFEEPLSGDPSLLMGISASPGLAVGKVFQHRKEDLQIPEEGEDPYEERRRLEKALEKSKIGLEALCERFEREDNGAQAEIFKAHRELLDDPDLEDIFTSAIAKGKSAEAAWRCAYETHAGVLESLDNQILAARAVDLRDVGNRVMRILRGVSEEDLRYPEDTIIIAEELSPSDTAKFDKDRVLALCTVGGGATSHVAIIARSLDLPAIVGMEARALAIESGTEVIVDGTAATLSIAPSEQEIGNVRSRIEKMKEKRERDLAAALEPAISKDGQHLEIVANIAGPEEAKDAVSMGCEGVGLLRSEFLFLERRTEPGEEEQAKAYTKTLEALGSERTLTVRTLDVGGDKPLAYLPIPEEENPFLGERGIRVCLNRPEFFRRHLRAILKASQKGKLQVMFPMISSLDEYREAKEMLHREARKLGVKPIPSGIMVEVPAAAVKAELLAEEVDFFSIGTNDLTQYTLAMDRGHKKLAPKIDALNPAVLSLIECTVQGAHMHGKKVSICGGIASDPAAVPVLLGLGVDKLSVAVPSLPTVKAVIRELEIEACRELAQEALAVSTAEQVRALLKRED